MAAYNEERFLAAAIESILAQTFGDFEFHVVDDGSTDATSSILAHYAHLDRRIIVHTHPRNMGLPTSLNLACRAASTDIIARMDADDISLPERFARQFTFLKTHPDIGVLGTRVQVITEDDQRGPVWPVPAQVGLTAWTLLFTCIIAHPSVMLRRPLLEQIGYYPMAVPVEDYTVWMQLIRRTRMTNLDEVLVYYRDVSTSLSRSNSGRLEAESVRVFQETICPHLREPISGSDIGLLRAFARHRYPSAPEHILRLGILIERLYAHHAALPPLDAEDVSAIAQDAGVRLWLLSALAAERRAPRLAARLAFRALRLSPSSILPFSQKALGRLRGRNGRPPAADDWPHGPR
jgi:hypothetical protein